MQATTIYSFPHMSGFLDSFHTDNIMINNESRHNGSNAPSLRSLVMDEEKMRLTGDFPQGMRLVLKFP